MRALGSGDTPASVRSGLSASGARFVARSRRRAEALAARFSRVASVADDAAAALEGATLVVNATPLGLVTDELPVEPMLIPAGADVYDLTYRRGDTPWVHACRARGLRAADGLAMLVEQGALSFERWFGAAPDRQAMWDAVT